jgi:hypothetical protein
MENIFPVLGRTDEKDKMREIKEQRKREGRNEVKKGKEKKI